MLFSGSNIKMTHSIQEFFRENGNRASRGLPHPACEGEDGEWKIIRHALGLGDAFGIRRVKAREIPSKFTTVLHFEPDQAVIRAGDITWHQVRGRY